MRNSMCISTCNEPGSDEDATHPQMEQCAARGGRQMLHVRQYRSMMPHSTGGTLSPYGHVSSSRWAASGRAAAPAASASDDAASRASGSGATEGVAEASLGASARGSAPGAASETASAAAAAAFPISTSPVGAAGGASAAATAAAAAEGSAVPPASLWCFASAPTSLPPSADAGSSSRFGRDTCFV